MVIFILEFSLAFTAHYDRLRSVILEI